MSLIEKPIAIVSPMKKSRKTRSKSPTKKIAPKENYENAKRPDCKKNINDINNFNNNNNSNKNRSKTMRNPNFRKYSMPQFVKRLCSKVDILDDASCPVILDVDRRISEHDRKILDRMAIKLKREISNIEIAHRARIVWENEKDERLKLQREQEEEYRNYLKIKRAIEKEYNDKKIKENEELHEWEREYLNNIIFAKDQAAENRLKMINFQKINYIQEKQEIAREKFENILVAMREKKFDEILWRKELDEMRKEKNAKAELNRDVLLHFIKQRTINDNKIHTEMHRQNWNEQRMLQIQQLLELKKRVQEKNEKMEDLRVKKENFIRKSRQMADSTAKMREELKRSLSPDAFQKGNPWFHRKNVSNTEDKYNLHFSPHSYDSHIKLG